MTPATVFNAITSPIRAVTSPVASLLSPRSSAPSAPTAAPTATSSTSASSNTSNTASSSNTASTITGGQQSLASDQQMFLKLLTAQLKNQDPLSPLDANQFTAQLVAMNGVQQQIVTNQLLQQLVNQKSGAIGGDPVGLIGKNLTASTDQAALQGGKAGWLYSLEGPAKDVTVQVLDSFGRVVWQTDAGALPAGEQSLNWDGKDLTGKQRPDGGVYTLKVTATDTSGGAVKASIYQRGVGGAVESANGQGLINLNGLKIPLSAIIAVGTAT